MHDLGFKFKQKILVFWIVFRGLHLLACEGFDRIQVLPKSECYEMSNVAFCPLKDMDTDIALHGLIVRDGTRVGEFAICIRLCGGYSAMPHSYDHVYNSTE